MLDVIGLKTQEELVSYLPEDVLFRDKLDIPNGKSEYDIVDYFRRQGDRNGPGYASFLGAGVYRHFRPVLVDTVVSRGEFLTSYTPYQAEIAQGTLTSIFEFQTMVCQLTGMDVANASMYDGSSAIPEAAMMAVRIKQRDRVLVARSVHPEYREVLATYAKHQGMPIDALAYDQRGRLDMDELKSKLSDDVAAVIIQSPNFFGIVEQIPEIAAFVHGHGALLVVAFTEAVALGLLEPPRDADIVVGELQSFAITPSYGGPHSGIIATRDQFVRQIPGRLVGETVDKDGRRAFCLTLATREQHIRREKATSNICTNQALIALMATVFMTVYGKEGLRELAEQNLSKAHYLAQQLPLQFDSPFFNEFVVRASGKRPDQIEAELLEQKIVGGLDLGRFYPELEGSVLLCATEMSKRADMDRVVAAFTKN
jgi:glycine dehydrogenase subunit 1